VQYDGPSLDKAAIFSAIKRKNLCDTLSSVSDGCGTRDDLVLTGTVDAGRIYEIRCDNTTRKLVIG
jgi:hypothetical protein